jgi:hypothetical protein
MTYPEAYAQKLVIEKAAFDAARVLRYIPGVGAGPMGLTPDAVKAKPEYQQARAAADKTFQTMRAYNAWFCKKFAREYRAAVAERRAI